jgi:hypothetical protein
MKILLGTICALFLIPIIWKNIPDRIEPTQKNKILGHIFFLFIDLFSLWLLWMGYNEIKEIITGFQNQADVIHVGSRVGFYVVGAFIPATHIFIIVNSFFPVIEKKYSRLVNKCCVVVLITLLATGFFGSSFIRVSVENAGYTYCRNASGISSLARTLVYTKNIDICDELVESKRKRQK